MHLRVRKKKKWSSLSRGSVPRYLTFSSHRHAATESIALRVDIYKFNIYFVWYDNIYSFGLQVLNGFFFFNNIFERIISI